MANYQPRQVLTSWGGDTPSLLAEMKRQAGVRTDRALAEFMAVAQSTVAYWRSRGKVPESAILNFEQRLELGARDAGMRALAARMIVFRLGELWYQTAKDQGATGERWVFYFSVAGSMQSIIDASFNEINRYETQFGVSTIEAAAALLENEAFLTGMIKWVSEIPLDAALAREVLTPPKVHFAESPQ